MNKQWFEDEVTEWYELIEAAEEVNCHMFDDFMDSDQYDEAIEDDINNRDCSWESLIDYLRELPSSCTEYIYRREGWFEYYCYDEYSFGEYKDEFIEWADNHDVWEDTPETNEAEIQNGNEKAVDTDDTPIDDGFSIALFMSCNAVCNQASKETAASSEAAAPSVKDFLDLVL